MSSIPLPVVLIPDDEIFSILASRYTSLVISGIPNSNATSKVVKTYVKGREDLDVVRMDATNKIVNHVNRLNGDSNASL